MRVKKKAGRYHHGSLRDALILAAEQTIAKTGEVDLPLRDLARRAGVSHAAAYRHFASKDALLAEIAIRGSGALAARLEAAAAAGGGPEARLVEAGVAYAQFALEETGAFRVMFHASLKPFTRFEGLAEAAHGALSVLDGLVREGIAALVLRPDAPEVSVMSAWSVIHGYATLLLDGQLAGPFRVQPEQGLASARVVMSRLVDGLTVRLESAVSAPRVRRGRSAPR